MFAASYIAAFALLSFLTARYAPKPNFSKVSGGKLLLMFSVYLSAAIICWNLPTMLVAHYGWSTEPGWLLRASQVVGAICGFYVAYRGVVIWGSLAIIGAVGTLAFSLITGVVGYVTG